MGGGGFPWPFQAGPLELGENRSKDIMRLDMHKNVRHFYVNQ